MGLKISAEEIDTLAEMLEGEYQAPHDALTRATGTPIERPWDLGQLDTSVLVRLLLKVEQCTNCGCWTRTEDLTLYIPDEAICPRCA